MAARQASGAKPSRSATQGDGGCGALSPLGARFLDVAGQPLPPGGVALRRLAWVRLDRLWPSPPGEVEMLADVTTPLLDAPAGVRPADLAALHLAHSQARPA